MSDTQDAGKCTKVQESLYILPRDERERRRLTLQNYLLLRAFDNKALHAPVELQDSDWVLDAGTGSGAWLQDIVDRISTKPQYIGIDINPALFPEASTRPPNMRFEIQSVTALPKEWKDKFTLVHQRLLIAGLRRHEWETALKEIYGVLKPGGWVQLLERRDWVGGPTLTKFRDAMYTFSDDVGLMARDISLRLPNFLRQSGFINIHEVSRGIPLSPSRGQDGADGKIDAIGVLHGYGKAIMKRGGYGIMNSETECEELLENIAKEIDSTPGSTITFTMFWAQKPLE